MLEQIELAMLKSELQQQEYKGADSRLAA